MLIERYPGSSHGGMVGGRFVYHALRPISVTVELPSWRWLGDEGRSLSGSEGPWGLARALVGLDLRELGVALGGGAFAGDSLGRRAMGAEIVLRLRVGSVDAIALVVDLGQPVWTSEGDVAARDVPRSVRVAVPIRVPLKRAPRWAIEVEVAGLRGPLRLLEAQMRVGVRRRWSRIDLATSLLWRRATDAFLDDESTAFTTLGLELGARLRPPASESRAPRPGPR